MRVGLVNTNRYLSPPVVPVGLEYLVGPLKSSGHEPRVCDLAFGDEPSEELLSFVEEFRPEVICLSVRNIDTAVYLGNLFFLDGIRDMIVLLKRETDLRVIVGGSASLASPGALRDYLGADAIVVGPGERALPFLLESGEETKEVRGFDRGIEPGIVHSRGEYVDYTGYVGEDDPVGIEFRKGCPWGCAYCIERRRPVLVRDAGAVVEEMASLVDMGLEHFFFSDSELNLDLGMTKLLLESMRRSLPRIRWTAYLRPTPMDRELMRLISKSGGKTVTISLESPALASPVDPAVERYGIESGQRDAARDFILWAQAEGIKVSVDLLVGFPGESVDSVRTAIDFLYGMPVSSVGVGSHFRLYGGTPLAERVSDDDFAPHLKGALVDNPGMLRPLFYGWLDTDRLRGMLPDRDRFHVAGDDRRVNYQRVD